jgi:hypothetical protein
VRFQVLRAMSMKIIIFKMVPHHTSLNGKFLQYIPMKQCLHYQSDETSVYLSETTGRYIPEGYLTSLYSVRFQVLTAASMKFRIVFWDVLPCKIIVD